ncbi:MAG: DUF4212 domain-containing protein [Rhodothermaceae bacterium]|nr:DUF4212 domain-containing protein [Rhodothermaceae bacterium]
MAAEKPEQGKVKRESIDRQAYWRSQIRRTIGLLIIWAVVGFGLSILGVEFLNGFTFNNMPLGFWMAQQGAIIVFVLLILSYAILTQRAEAE